MSDHSTPTFWMWSFKFNKPMHGGFINVPVGIRRVHHLVNKGHVVSLLVFGRIFTCVSFCRSLNLSEEFLASGLRFVGELLAQRLCSGNGTSEVWRFFEDVW